MSKMACSSVLSILKVARVTVDVPRPSKRGRFFFIPWVQMTPVFIKDGESEPTHAAELQRRLIQALTQSGHPPRDGLDLQGLVTEALRCFKPR